MRMIAIAVLAALPLAVAGTADAQSRECKETWSGAQRCEYPDGHVTERRVIKGGGSRTTSTNPDDWGRSDGEGRAITPPDEMIRNSPILRSEALGRPTDPWAAPIPSPWETRTVPVEGGWKAR